MDRISALNIQRFVKLHNLMALEDPYILKIDEDSFLNENLDKLESESLLIMISREEGLDTGYIFIECEESSAFVEEIYMVPRYKSVEGYKALLSHGLDELKKMHISSARHISPLSNPLFEDALGSSGFIMDKEHIQMERPLSSVSRFSLQADTSIRTFNDIRDCDWIFDFMKGSIDGTYFNYSMDEIQKLVHNDGELNFVLFKEGKPAGFMIAYINQKRNLQENRKVIYIEELAVTEAFRRLGVASAMINLVFKKGLELGADTARLHVYRSNSGAYNLYRKLGFENMKSIGHWVVSIM